MDCKNEKLEVSKERRRQYKKDNKEHIAQKQKEWYEVNQDKILQQKKEYAKENNEILTKKTNCLCGGFYQHKHKRQHEFVTKEQKII